MTIGGIGPRPRLCLTTAAVAMSLTVGHAMAEPVLWKLSGVTFGDGATASGSFYFDPDAGTPCGPGTFVCGQFSDVDIVTTAGSAGDGGSFSGATYQYVCGTDDAACQGTQPASNNVTFLTSNVSDQTGLTSLFFRFTGDTGTPPAGLTDAGGTVILGDSLTTGYVFEATCLDASCDTTVNPDRTNNAGELIGTVPEPSGLLLVGFAIAALHRTRRRFSSGSPESRPGAGAGS
jgi:hypothetical protein